MTQTTLTPASTARPTRTGDRPRALVVGAGIGGLAVVLRLDHLGYDVTVCERNPTPGGRCNQMTLAGGFTFDTGPSILLMREVFDELFRSLGEDLDDHVDMVRIQPNYRCVFSDGSELTLTGDLQRLRDQLEGFEPGAGDALLRFLADAGHKYEVLRARFLVRNFRSWGEFLSPGNLPHFIGTGVMRRLGSHVGRYFRDPRLRCVFSFHSMYVGTSPQYAPSVFAFLPYSELCEGIWYPRGGMYRLVMAMAEVAERRGVELLLDTEVTRIEQVGRRATGVRLADGRLLTADVVVCNADLTDAVERLLDPATPHNPTTRQLDRLRYGCSALTAYLGVRGDIGDLGHHNFYFAADMDANYDAIFRHAAVPADPSFYVNVPSVTDPGLAPPGHHSVFLLGPCATTDRGLDWRGGAALEYREKMLDSLEARFRLPGIRDRIVVEHLRDPEEWRDLYHLRRGATFGVAADFLQSGYMRPANRHAGLSNLYFVGASTVPGCGVPTVAISAALAAERIAQEQGVGAQPTPAGRGRR